MLNLPKNKIKLIASDFDGVLTDCGLYITSDGGSLKKLCYKDIMGVSCWLKQGGKFAIISGDKSVMIDVFATKLNIEDVFQETLYHLYHHPHNRLLQKTSYI